MEYKDIVDTINSPNLIRIVDNFKVSKELYESKLDAVRDNFNRVKELVSADDQLFKLINEN